MSHAACSLTVAEMTSQLLVLSFAFESSAQCHDGYALDHRDPWIELLHEPRQKHTFTSKNVSRVGNTLNLQGTNRDNGVIQLKISTIHVQV